MILFLKERRVAIKLTVIIEKEGDGYISSVLNLILQARERQLRRRGII